MVLVQRFEIRKTRKGENFAALTVNPGRAGNFGAMDAKIWQFDRFARSGRPLPSEGTLIEATYTTGEYQGTTQWTIEDYRIVEGEERTKTLEDFVPTSRIDEAFYHRKLESLIEQTDGERVAAQVLREVFDRTDFRESFYRAPAAIAHHQSYPGGLLEHTLNVTALALALADAYASGSREGLTFNSERLTVDRTLIISAGLLHDIGKVQTYRFAPLAEPTDANRFEGHLSISYAIVSELARPYRENPAYDGAREEIDKLMNCILSHHGSLEFGSPVLPACAEAFILSQADLTDARLASFVTEGNKTLRQNPEAQWVRLPHFPSGLFIGDLPRPPGAE